MNVGYFISPHKRSILIVMGFERWLPHILMKGYDFTPKIVRPATTDEVVYLEENYRNFPHWEYTDLVALLIDEEYDGADHAHLTKVLDLSMVVADRSPEPHAVSD